MSEIKYTGTEFSIRIPKQVKWGPQEDITPYELAQAMPVLLMMASAAYLYSAEGSVLALPQCVQRHFKIGS